MRTAYKFVKEFGEGVDRICTELEQTGTPLLVFHPNYFILQTTLYEEVIDVPANAQITTESTQKSARKEESTLKSSGKTTRKSSEKTTQKTTQKSSEKTTQKIVALIKANPNVTTEEMAQAIGIIRRNIAKNIKKLQEQGIVRRVGPDKGGHWEIIK